MQQHSQQSPDEILDNLLSGYGNPPPELPARICQLCAENHHDFLTLFRSINWTSMLGKAAALIAVACLSSYFTTMHMTDAGATLETTPALAAVPRQLQPPNHIQSTLPQDTGFSLSDSIKLASQHTGNSISQLQKVSTDSSQDIIPGISRNIQLPQNIFSREAKTTPVMPQEITHIWLSSKKNSEILACLPGNARLVEGKDKSGTATYRLTSTFSELQTLVSDLHDKHGFTLLSNVPPQPEEKIPQALLSNMHQDVCYTMKVICK